jgi:hypothetical protein
MHNRTIPTVELSNADFNKGLEREDSFKPKTTINILHAASWISIS